VPSHVIEACPPGSTQGLQQQDVPAEPDAPLTGDGGGWWTRGFDLLIASAAVVLSLPVIVCLALLVRLDSSGPVLFRQERIGRGGAPFSMLKFRSMYHNSDDQRHRADASAWFAAQPNGASYKTLSDPRITRAGRFLRKTSLDELPQLFNVLRGEMSLVGPRPPLPSEVELYEVHHYARFDVKPGMTGPWQVSGRNDITDFEHVLTLEKAYIREWSLAHDLRILLKTVPVVLARRGAH
jgi:lipopolysaccharide/colanic/teichoic acid biosynthesis glycosyltransferase